MDVFEKEWHQLTIEIYLDSAWSMIHLKTWDIFSTKHPKFFFLFLIYWSFLISTLKFHFDFLSPNLYPLWIPLLFLNFHFEISHRFPLDFLFSSLDFHLTPLNFILNFTLIWFKQNKKHRQHKQNKAKQQTNSKQSSKSRTTVSLTWMLISTWIPLLFPNFHIEFPRWYIDFHTSFSSKAAQTTSITNKKSKKNRTTQAEQAKAETTSRTNKKKQKKAKNRTTQTEQKKAKTELQAKQQKQNKDSLAWMLIPLDFLISTLNSTLICDFHTSFQVEQHSSKAKQQKQNKNFSCMNANSLFNWDTYFSQTSQINKLT
jgi:hypothetical protein